MFRSRKINRTFVCIARMTGDIMHALHLMYHNHVHLDVTNVLIVIVYINPIGICYSHEYLWVSVIHWNNMYYMLSTVRAFRSSSVPTNAEVTLSCSMHISNSKPFKLYWLITRSKTACHDLHDIKTQYRFSLKFRHFQSVCLMQLHLREVSGRCSVFGIDGMH